MTAEELLASQRRGRDLFYGTVANCVKCHGESALGDGELTDYDDWAKEFIGDGKRTRSSSSASSWPWDCPRRGTSVPATCGRASIAAACGRSTFTGGLRNGIEGTPMPAATMKPDGDPNAKGLTPDDIWDMVNYVQSLPYEPISNPFDAVPTAPMRERSS